MITILFELLETVLRLYWWAVILAAVASNLIAFGVVDTRNRLVWTVSDFLYRVTEPALRRIRGFLPSFGGLDLSPIIFFLLLQALTIALHATLDAPMCAALGCGGGAY